MDSYEEMCKSTVKQLWDSYKDKPNGKDLFTHSCKHFGIDERWWKEYDVSRLPETET